jgi:hypothetical protein
MLGRVINGDDSARLPARLGARWGPLTLRLGVSGTAPSVELLE